MNIRCKLYYNDKGYGKGNAYIAKIIGKDKKYKFKRIFVKRDIEYNNTSSTVWYEYSWDIIEDGIYEWNEENSFKHERNYFKYTNSANKMEQLELFEVKKIIDAEEIRTSSNIEEYCCKDMENNG